MRREGLADAAIREGTPLLAAIYNRVSIADKETKSVRGQHSDNTEACDELGWVWTDESTYTDSKSASRFAKASRPDWGRLVEDLRAAKYPALVLWESSRGDRDLEGWIGLLNLCRRLGILIHITSHERTYDVRLRRDYRTLAEEGVDASDESEKISSRVTRGVEKAAVAGRPHGRLLYGFRRVYDPETGRLAEQIPDEEARTAVAADGVQETYTPAGVVAEIATRWAAGESARSIALDLNRRGIPTPKNGPKGWTGERVRNLAANPGYGGKRVHRGKVIGDAMWKPILDAATYQAVQAKAADPTRRRKHDTAVKHLGSGLYVCGVCKGVIRVNRPHGVPTYVCWPKQPTGKSFHVGRKQEDVDAYVQMSVWERLVRPDILEILAEDRRADERFTQLTAEVAEKQARLDEAADAYAAGKLALDRLTRIESSLLPEIEAARARMQQARVGPLLRGLVLPDVADIEAEWWRRSLPERREVIRALVERIEILPLGRARAILRNFAPEESVRIMWRKSGGDTAASPELESTS